MSHVEMIKEGTKSADFVSNNVSIQAYAGYSIEVKTTNSTADFRCNVHLDGAGTEAEDTAVVSGTLVPISNDNVVIYNVSQAYYNWVRVDVTVMSGSATFRIRIIRKR